MKTDIIQFPTAASPPVLENALVQCAHAHGAYISSIEKLLGLLAGSPTEIVMSRRGERSVLAPIKFTHEFYTCGRYVFTAQKVHTVTSINSYINIVIL